MIALQPGTGRGSRARVSLDLLWISWTSTTLLGGSGMAPSETASSQLLSCLSSIFLWFSYQLPACVASRTDIIVASPGYVSASINGDSYRLHKRTDHPTRASPRSDSGLVAIRSCWQTREAREKILACIGELLRTNGNISSHHHLRQELDIMSFSSPLFSQLNGLTSNEAKVSKAFPLHAAAEERPQGVGLFARFAFAGAVCVRTLKTDTHVLLTTRPF